MSSTIFERFQRIVAMPPALDRALSLKNKIYSLIAKNKISLEGVYLDIGCGLGINTLIFSELFSEIFALDVSKKAVQRSKSTFSKENIPAHFVIGDAQKLPFKEYTFDVITAFSLIEHVVSKEKFVGEIVRILKKQGVFVMQFPNANFPIDFHTGLFFPQIIPRMLKELYGKKILKWGSFHVWNLTNKKACKISKIYFKNIYVDRMNYSEDVISTKFFRLLYKLFKKLQLLKICPLGYLIVCTNLTTSDLLPSNH